MITPELDFTEKNGLVLCDRLDCAQNHYERLYLTEASKLKAYAVFFRRFFKGKADKELPYKSEPTVCFFREENVPFNSSAHKSVHAALWSEGKIDVYIIFGKTRLDIYNARKPAEKLANGDVTLDSEALKLADSAFLKLNKERFSARLFGTGTFWEQTENKKNINVDNSPYKHLMDYLMNVRSVFNKQNEQQLEPKTIDKLLVLSILVKFLEEKKDAETERSTLDEIYSKHQVKNLEETVNKSKFLDVLNDLSNEFNGKVFDQFNNIEKGKIRNANLGLLSEFLSAEIDIAKRQRFLWKQYNFQYLPAEVISTIYEYFIQTDAERDGKGREKGVVYTPIHLVNFLVDEVMPLDEPHKSFKEKGVYKILDPTCGSGVFLVAAYKRLLQWWTVEKYRETGKIEYPDKEVAQKILEDNIYGVDVKDTAVLVTIFGLTTALLDHLTPTEVWGKLKFKDLSKRNIVQGEQPTGFFWWALGAKNRNEHFSLAIGNPPFNEEKGVSKGDVLNADVINSLELRHKKIPRNNFALHFFEASMLLADRVCMIVPSNVLLYSKSSQNYREQLFKNYSISNIYDFTHLRETLFVKKNETKKRTGRTPVVALIAKNTPSECSSILHTVVKRTTSLEQKVRFEIDDYDRYLVKWDWAVDSTKQFIWKANLLGGGRLFHLIYRLSLLRTLKDYINSNQPEWLYNSGYKIGGKTEKIFAPFMSKGDEINRIHEDGSYELISQDKMKVEMVEYFPNPMIYTPPLLIMDQVLGKENIPVTLIKNYSKKFIYFNRDFVGIHAPADDLDKLELIYKTIKIENKALYRLYVLNQSGSSLVLTETEINKRDIDILPYPEIRSNLNLSQSEKIIQEEVLEYYIHLGKVITKKSDGAVLHQPVKEKQLSEYGEVLCNELNDIYAQNDNSWQLGKVYRMPSYTVYQIGFGEEGKLKHEFLDKLDVPITALINNDISNRGASYKRIVRLYQHVDGFDCVYFIKPNALRYWLKSIALRDADETFADFKNGDY